MCVEGCSDAVTVAPALSIEYVMQVHTLRTLSSPSLGFLCDVLSEDPQINSYLILSQNLRLIAPTILTKQWSTQSGSSVTLCGALLQLLVRLTLAVDAISLHLPSVLVFVRLEDLLFLNTQALLRILVGLYPPIAI